MTPPTPTWVVLHGGALGDLVLTIQLARAVSEVAAAREWLVVSRNDPGDLSPQVDGISRRSLEGVGAHWLYAETEATPPPALAALVARRTVISALGSPESIVHRRLVMLGPAALYSFDPRPRGGLDGHITDQWRDDLARQGLLFIQRSDGGARRAAERQRLAPCELHGARLTGRRAAPAGPRTIILAPGAGSAAKCWPLANYLEVARRLATAADIPQASAAGREAFDDAARALSPIRVAFLIGPAELERWPRSQRDSIAREFPVVESPSPNELVRLLASSAACLGNDAGPSHLAALLGTATVTIFGPTAAKVWCPLGRRTRAIQGNPDADAAAWGLSCDSVVAEMMRLLESASSPHDHGAG